MQHPVYRMNYYRSMLLGAKIQHKPAQDNELYGKHLVTLAAERCELLAKHKRPGPTGIRRRRSSSGSSTLGAVLQEFCCKDHPERRGDDCRY